LQTKGELHVALYFKKLKYYILRFQKIWKKWYMVYATNLQNINVELFVFWATQKWQNLTILKYALFTILRSTHLSFLYSLQYNEFYIEILHNCRFHYWLHLEFIFRFLKIYKYDFRFFKNKELCVARSHFIHSRKHRCLYI
jgi:hypothetical protein